MRRNQINKRGERKILQMVLVYLFIAFITLPTFLQNIHAFEHFNENHCTEKSVHLENNAEQCELCDIVPITLDRILTQNVVKEPLFAELDYSQVVVENIKTNESYFYALRGPPMFLLI